MPRFLIFSFVVLFIFLFFWFWVIFKWEPGPFLNNLVFSILAFLNLTIILTVVLFLLRTVGKNRLKSWLSRHTPPIEISQQRIIFRKSFKMSLPVAAFASVLIFIKTLGLLNTFNLIIFSAIVATCTIYIYLKSRGAI